jgi:mannose/cellobiose epimerase-like protein (N-acyl-D-glucosamine 2-epimerase family)
MQYVILEDTDLNTLGRLVNAACSDGWRPQGGVAISQTFKDHLPTTPLDIFGNREYVTLFCQAIIKE